MSYIKDRLKQYADKYSDCYKYAGIHVKVIQDMIEQLLADLEQDEKENGRIQTGSYTNKDGQKVYTTDIVIEEQDFAESKAASQQNNSGNTQNASNNQQAQQPKPQTSPDGFMSADDEGLPFH